MNTNNPDYVKHAKAALASKAEMDKWKRIEIYDAIAAISFLAIAWFVSSWLVAIAGIVICGAVGAYATSKKEKAKQDTLDHINRSEGMSESLVQASRGRREAENALASAIKKLDEASSKLRSATTYDEKKKAEAEVVSAQAAIEGAKLRLQQAATRESIETQKSQQQASSAVEVTNQVSQNKDSFKFSGEKDLSVDGYRIYLVKKYSIEKNEVLGKFVCGERLFDDIEGALSHADSIDDAHGVLLETSELHGIPEVPVIPELQVDMQDLRNAQGDSSSLTPEANFKKNNTNKIIIAALVIAVCIGALYFIFGKSGDEVKQASTTRAGNNAIQNPAAGPADIANSHGNAKSDQSLVKFSFGELSLVNDDLLLNGRQMNPKITGNFTYLQKEKLPNSGEVILLAEVGGNACPYLYTAIVFNDANNYKASKPFGTCSDIYTFSVIDGIPTLTTPEMNTGNNKVYALKSLVNVSSNQISPSFDCSKAKSPSEKLICSDSQLAKEDNELQALYNAAKLKAKDPVAFKAMTTAAWKEREVNCLDRVCVLNWYASRKAVYQNIINGAQ